MSTQPESLQSQQEPDSFDQFFQQAETRPGYWTEKAKLEFTREIYCQMRHRGLSKSELASKLDVSPGMVTRLLSGRNNFELETMVRIAMALDCRYLSHLQPREAKTFWCDVFAVRTQNVLEPWNPDEFKPVLDFQLGITSVDYVPIAINT